MNGQSQRVEPVDAATTLTLKKKSSQRSPYHLEIHLSGQLDGQAKITGIAPIGMPTLRDDLMKPDMKRVTGPCQHDSVGDTIAFEVDVLQHEFLQLIKTAEIEHVFEACEGEILRSFGIIKRF